MSRHVKIFIVKDKGKDKEVKMKIRGKDKNNNLMSFHILFFYLIDRYTLVQTNVKNNKTEIEIMQS